MKRALLLAALATVAITTPAVAQETPGPDPDSCIYDPNRPIFDSTDGLNVELRSWSSDEALPFSWQTATGYIGDNHMVSVSKIVCDHYFISAAVVSPLGRDEENRDQFKRLISALHLPEEPAPLSPGQWDILQRSGELYVRTATASFSYFYAANDAFYTYSFHHQFMVP